VPRILEYAAATPAKTRFGMEIEVSVEPQLAGGAVWHARDRLDESFFLLNGDSWFDFNLLETRYVDCERARSNRCHRPHAISRCVTLWGSGD
jgi:hypothetical protein